MGAAMVDNRWIGKARALERMRQIPVDVRIAVRLQIHVQAAFLTEQIRSAAPVVTGDLKDSVEWHPNPRKDKISAVVTAGRGLEAGYGRRVEFGTPGQQASPFFYPTYRAFRRKIRAAISKAGRTAINLWGS